VTIAALAFNCVTSATTRGDRGLAACEGDSVVSTIEGRNNHLLVQRQLATDLIEQLVGVPSQPLEIWIVGLIGGAGER
jgi:hypothetical protein